MEHERIRELANMFRALEDEDIELLTEHLPSCADCREKLIVLDDAADALRHARKAPPAELRGRVLDRIRRDRARSRWVVIVLATIAGAVGTAAIGLGVWVYSLSHDLAEERRSVNRAALVVTALASSPPTVVPISGADGSLVVERDGRAILVVSGLRAAPPGRTYQAWVARGDTYTPAGLFAGGETTIHRLSARAFPGLVVVGTIEPAGGSLAPTREPLFEARVSR